MNLKKYIYIYICHIFRTKLIIQGYSSWSSSPQCRFSATPKDAPQPPPPRCCCFGVEGCWWNRLSRLRPGPATDMPWQVYRLPLYVYICIYNIHCITLQLQLQLQLQFQLQLQLQYITLHYICI